MDKPPQLFWILFWPKYKHIKLTSAFLTELMLYTVQVVCNSNQINRDNRNWSRLFALVENCLCFVGETYLLPTCTSLF